MSEFGMIKMIPQANKLPEHLHEMRNTAAKPIEAGGQHNLDFSAPHRPDEFVQVGDNMDIFFPTSPHTILPKRVASRAPRINYDHTLTLPPFQSPFQARLKARVGLFLDFESTGPRRSQKSLVRSQLGDN
jgi:hypothetical protein